ncbi:MAG: hypothetical protein LUD00_07185 [Prevotellaceae bacterium]|nr:hypothetical protein [Prevotellaceae bacterium]
MFSADSSCIFSGCVLDRFLMCDLYVLADVFDRLLRRKLPNCSYSAIAPNLGEEPI